jgi:hypothetical protein
MKPTHTPPSSPVIVAHRSSPSRSFLLARTRRGLRGLHLDSSHAAGRGGGSYEEENRTAQKGVCTGRAWR